MYVCMYVCIWCYLFHYVFQGTEFLGKPFRDLLKSKHVQHSLAGGTQKAGSAEAAIAKLRSHLARIETYLGENQWPSQLKNALSAANQTPHSRYRLAPADVDNTSAGTVFLRKYGKYYFDRSRHEIPTEENTTFPPGTPVRLLLAKKGFSKKSTPTYSAETFYIRHIRPTVPLTYQVVDWEGEPVIETFYEHELAKAENQFQQRRRIEKVHRKQGRLQEVSFKNHPLRFKEWLTAQQLKTAKSSFT